MKETQIDVSIIALKVIEYLNSKFPLCESLKKEILNDIKIEFLKPHDIILKEGQVSNAVTLVVSGLLRSYYYKDEQEYTSRFTPEHEIVLSVGSFYNRKPGYEFIEAVEPTIIAQISFEKQQHYLSKYIEYNILVRVFTEKYYAMADWHLFQMRKQTAEEKWNYFLEQFPNLVQKVQLKHIASFLGMRLETLSRVRSQYK
jgi:hypothetical protein